jgi:hypothetical protein
MTEFQYWRLVRKFLETKQQQHLNFSSAPKNVAGSCVMRAFHWL